MRIWDFVSHWGRVDPDSIALRSYGGETTYSQLKALAEDAAEQASRFLPDAAFLQVDSRCDYLLLAGWLGAWKAGRTPVLRPGRHNSLDCVRFVPVPSSLLSIAPCGVERASVGCGVFLSSGTTGEPKVIARSEQSLLNEMVQWVTELSLRRRDRVCITRPFTYSGTVTIVLSVLMAGGAAEVVGVEDVIAEGSENNVRRHLCVSGARDIRRMAKCFGAGRQPVANGGLIVSEPWDRETFHLFAQMLELSPAVAWGTTEGLGSIATSFETVGGTQSVGREFCGERLFVVDDDGREVGAGCIGRLAGDVLTGHVGARQLDHGVLEEARIISEDYGWQDSCGMIYFLGRSHERQLVTHLFPESIAESESWLRRQTGCAEVCIVSTSERRVGVVFERSLRKDGAEDVVRRWAHQRSLVCDSCLFVDELPTTDAGKVDRSLLLRMLKA
jgi:acyl-coenzyme A synthetase/AMP-(fatty) acid ligase